MTLPQSDWQYWMPSRPMTQNSCSLLLQLHHSCRHCLQLLCCRRDPPSFLEVDNPQSRLRIVLSFTIFGFGMILLSASLLPGCRLQSAQDAHVDCDWLIDRAPTTSPCSPNIAGFLSRSNTSAGSVQRPIPLGRRGIRSCTAQQSYEA